MSRISICSSSDLHIDILKDLDDQIDQVDNSIL